MTHVLVVDDDQRIRKALSPHLSDVGHSANSSDYPLGSRAAASARKWRYFSR
jgi:DNA-binding NtrC family response regulator